MAEIELCRHDDADNIEHQKADQKADPICARWQKLAHILSPKLSDFLYRGGRVLIATIAKGHILLGAMRRIRCAIA